MLVLFVGGDTILFVDNCHGCKENIEKRKSCEERSHRWITNATWTDGQLRIVLSFLDYHRERSQKREWIEKLRERIIWILEQQP